MYGNAAAELYIHDNRASVDTAVSLKGKQLSDEPNAFVFRRVFHESCQAELKEGLARLGAVFIARAADLPPAKSNERAPMPIPSPRIVAGTDPETLANLEGGFIIATVTPSAVPEASAVRIRKFGPDYYYVEPLVIESLRDRMPGPEFTLVGSAHARPQPHGASTIAIE
jgi:hypothetical protein